MTITSNGATSRLRATIETAVAESGRSMQAFTVLAAQNDPFRTRADR